jgi:S-adenosylmethionine hydrolase
MRTDHSCPKILRRMRPSLPLFRVVSVVLLALAWSASGFMASAKDRAAVVFQSDFGLKDGAVSAMKGVALGVDPALPLHDITHEIPPFNIWEAAYRLKQTAKYWPSNTVFVSVCDPGVGTERRAVVLRTRSGHRFVTPDNGTLTFVAETLGVAELRVIDIARQRLRGSEESYTFHGRDLFAYVAARLAAGRIRMADVGPLATNGVVELPYQKPEFRDGVARGNIPVLDPNYGNVWSDIGKPVHSRLNPRVGERFEVRILEKDRVVWSGVVPFAESFGNVPEGQPLLFINSLLELAVALNQGDFARTHGIRSGPEWSLEVRRP